MNIYVQSIIQSDQISADLDRVGRFMTHLKEAHNMLPPLPLSEVSYFSTRDTHKDFLRHR